MMFFTNRPLGYKIAHVFVAMMILGGMLFSPMTARAVHAQTEPFHLVIDLLGPTYVQPGQTITYELRVENLTDQAMTNIAFYNDLPANTSFVSNDDGGYIEDGGLKYVVFTLPSLPAHTKHTVTWVARADGSLAVGTIITNNSFDFIDPPPGTIIGFGGPVRTLVEAPGTLVASYKNANGVAFDVNVHGYQFQNYGGSLNNADDLSKEDVFAFFGPGVCQSGTTAADCVLSGPAQTWLDKALEMSNGGHCDGMASTSLRLFNSLPYNQYSSPGTFQPGAVNTIDLTYPAQPIENYIAHYFQTQSFIWDEHVTGTPVELVQRLITDFNRTPSVGYSLAFFKTNHLNAVDESDWTHGHAVTAIGVEKVTASEYRILVYDNNFPKQREYFTVDMINNTWTYSTASTPGNDPEAYVGTAFSGNLHLVPLSARDKPAGEYFYCDFCNQTATASGNGVLASSVQTQAGMISGVIDFHFTGEGDILVVNDHGERTGTDLDGNHWNEIPGAELIHPQGGLGMDLPPIIDVPFTEHDETYYSVFVHGKAADSPTMGTLSMHGFGYSLGMNDIALDPGEVFEITVSPDGDHISFTSTETVVAHEIFISHDPVHPGDPSVIFDIEGITVHAGEKVSLDLDPVLERIHFNDTGAQDEQFIIDMKLIWPNGDVQDWPETVHLPAGATSAYVFGAWDGLLDPAIYIDDVLQNPLVNHRLKLVSATGIYDPTPQPNAAAGVYHVEATFQNVTEVSLQDLYFTVPNLGPGEVILNADGGPAGAGATLSVPASALGAEGILHMNESFTFSFDVGLARPNFSSIRVDANGVPHDWIHPDPAPSYDANNASFVFDGKEGASSQIEKMKTDVQALVTNKYLKQNQANVLLRQLDRVQQYVAAGKPVRAIQAMGVFIVELNALGRKIPINVRLPLVAQAGFVILQLR